MKFLTKINRNYLLLFSALLIVLSVLGYFVLASIIDKNIMKSLHSQEPLIEKQLQAGQIPQLKPLVEVMKVNGHPGRQKVYKEVIIPDTVENEKEAYIEYSNYLKVNNVTYLVKIREAKFESEDLVSSIAVAIFTLLLAAFLISFIITRRLNKTIWNNFESNLKAIEQFDFTENNKLLLRSSNIEEFDRLNLVVHKLTDKLKKDFRVLKEFTENASHEIQSPLAIASLSLEEILQQELNEASFGKVVTAINAIKRLSVLNQQLLLLTKIENNQFAASEIILFNELIQRKIHEFELLFKEKNIEVNFINHSAFSAKMNMQLAEILINNLLSNAINHNFNHGSIHITAGQNEIVFCNTGAQNALSEETIFNRFVKGNSKSHGLGLAIVKQICDTHYLEVHYVKNEYHCFTVSRTIKQ